MLIKRVKSLKLCVIVRIGPSVRALSNIGAQIYR